MDLMRDAFKSQIKKKMALMAQMVSVKAQWDSNQPEVLVTLRKTN